PQRARAPRGQARRTGETWKERDNSSPAPESGGSAVYPRRVPRPVGQKLLSYDRRLRARFVAGADEAGRGSLAGPLVVAGVLLDYDCLRNHKVRPLASLNDSKQGTAAGGGGGVRA